MSNYSELMEWSDATPLAVGGWWVRVGGGFIRFPEPFNARAIRESAAVRPDLANQVRRTASGYTLQAGGKMQTPAKWGSGHG